MFSNSFWKEDDRGTFTAVDYVTPASKHQLNLILILLIYNDRYVLLIYFLPQSIAFTSVMFYKVFLQTVDLAY